MNPSETLQASGRQALKRLRELLEQATPENRDRAKLLAAFRQHTEREPAAAAREILGTLAQTVDAYLRGGASSDALQYYLAAQFGIAGPELGDLPERLDPLRDPQLAPEIQAYTEREPAKELPKISVIITTYNRKDYLRQAVESILRQDYPHFEIVVIDDCSSDGTCEMVERHFSGEPRVIYMRNRQNRGPGHNRRQALAAHGDGELILFLDDDDYLIDSGYFTRAALFHLQHPDISFVAANVFLEYTAGGRFAVSSLQLDRITPQRNYFRHFEQPGYPKPASTLTAVFKREALMKMDILNMKMVNDASIYLRALLIGDAGFIDTLAGVYRIHGNNITFHLSQSFLIENLEEKRLIRDMAADRLGFGRAELNEWFAHNVYDTVSYYLLNSAKNHSDYKAMYDWTRLHCPDAYHRLKRSFRTRLMKKQLLRVSFVRALLGR
ncbi:glycosyltransferase family 2 protein [Paenibacillus sp. NFR01]|uniref:glycosyltransferase family 2 protein n=1 Tax=Paenibacillus sp. NFR01 TaxID=1566279 RepID=UPI0008C06BB4|nr:glycosyltransferase family A protein [Paenibacillus sp. NFR01]SEU23299.1 Glycosyl transferase family 2 [Paenibacillus sp. NFR01]